MKKIIIYIITFTMLSFFVTSATEGDIVESGLECDTGRGFRTINNSFVCASILQIKQPQTLSLGITSNISQSALNKRHIFDNTIDLQDISGSTSIQIGTNLEGKEIKIRMIKEKNELIKAFIGSLIKLIIEFMKIIFYLIELRLMVYFFLTLIPNGFFKLRDAIVQVYMRRV